MKRCAGDAGECRLPADAEGAAREDSLAVHVDARDAQQRPDDHARERHGVAEPHELVVPQRDALPDVDAEHEQLECNRTARENHANGGGHAHGEAIETVRRLAALTRTAAGDPCDERADDEHDHRHT